MRGLLASSDYKLKQMGDSFPQIQRSSEEMDTIAGQTFDDVSSVLASLSLFGLSLLQRGGQ